MTSHLHEPKLSVFTIAYKSAGECRMVIQELLKQTARSEMEIIVVSPDRDGLDQHLLEGFGSWQWIILPEIRTCGKAMEVAVQAARAPFVTYAEEHSYFEEAWAERLIAAHEEGHDVVGFAMENANPNTLTSWAHLYGQFGPVVAPVASGERGFLAGHHTSYRRELLLEYGRLLSDVLEDEAALFLDLRARGKGMFLAGDAISRHINVSSLMAYMYMDYVGQRSFASARAQVGNWSWLKRGAYAAAAPLIPWIRLRRILADIRRTGRQRQLLPRILGPLGLALLWGAWGEMLGYILGAGDCAERKAPVELQRQKFLSRTDPWLKEGNQAAL
jgi:glycosyl transferase family 2